MQVKYAGPKVIFTNHGIEFDNNKEDKYAYLAIAIELLKAFDHECKPKQKYIYKPETKNFNDEDIMSFVRSNFEHYDKLIQQVNKDAEAYYGLETERAKTHRKNISEAEFNAWIKNIELMKSYVLQRQFNKNIYYDIINKITALLKTKAIKEVHLPMIHKFVHVLHSIQGVLKEKPEAKNSRMRFYESNKAASGELMVSLDID